MAADRDWRKKQRALVNALREAALYRSELRLVQLATHATQTVRLHELLDDACTVVHAGVTTPPPTGELALVVEDVDVECVVPVTVVDHRTLRVQYDAVTPAAWRSRTRWSVVRPVARAARHISPAGSHAALATVLAIEHGRWHLTIDTAAPLAAGDRLLVQATSTADTVTTFDVAQVDGPTVLATRRPLDHGVMETSVVPHRPLELALAIAELGTTLHLTTEQFTTTGCIGVTSTQTIELPQLIGARISPQDIACSLAVLEVATGRIEVRIQPGARVAWFNFLTRAVYGYDTRLRPEDARPITRLMQESRNYADRALRRRVELGDAIAASYALDTELPATRFRWLARHAGGHLVGHLMGIQASSRVWSAIDNVGSQSHPGRWNAQVVARWIRMFGELLAHLPGEPLIQWSFSVTAGVWTRFHQRIRTDRALVHAESAFQNIILDNLPPDDGAPAPEPDVEVLTSRELFDALAAARVDPNIERLLAAVDAGCTAGSDFAAAFEREYGKPHRRHYRRLRDDRGAEYLMTFSNHPTWPSLNQGHNFHYLVPLNDAPPPTRAVLQAIRQDVHAAGCEPFRVMYLGTECEYGTPWLDLLLLPAAMPLAAQAAEEF